MMIKQNKPYKVLLVGDCLANGGAERVHALLSGYFHNSGLEVHNCIFLDWITYEYSGSLLNLGKISPNGFFAFRKIKRFFVLQKFVRENHFDVIIDFRMRSTFWLEWLLSNFVYPENTIYSVRSGILEFYFPKSNLLAQFIYKKRTIVAVSREIQNSILQKKLSDTVYTVYNPLNFQLIDSLKDKYVALDENYILASGRMNEDVKQFDKLIVAYSKSILPENKIKLVLLGDGQKQSDYKTLVAKLGLNHLVEFKGFVDNPFPYYKNALFTILSSKNEGFPNVILESLSVGTPVISFDCFSGPSEIITNEFNGVLVENQNFEKLTQAMNLLLENKTVYIHCKKNAKDSVKQFGIEIIGQHWIDLFGNFQR